MYGNQETARKPVSLRRLAKMKAEGEKIACLTVYDATFARVQDAVGVDLALVGDSLGNVIQGHGTTVPVTMEDMVYHTRCAAAGLQSPLLVADLPFASCPGPEQAIHNAARLMRAGAAMVKLETSRAQIEIVTALAGQGIPVCAHLGLLPQLVHKQGFRVQGRDEAAARELLETARALVEAGADQLLLECVPRELAADITQAAPVPVIGIGAGAGVDGQILVLHDMLGIPPGKKPRFVHDFMADAGDIPAAIAAYVEAVKSGRYPQPEHGFD
ncbi:3-methyl-2-oxobutanoate hydroxymethyltransferase [Natronospira proteinivora]|uniref:3-methyl-2-oxobutanoate hydroxymethyltransferase n=1 Tax=Natronospira proteinivora TaxID=1807133 RepID=A0ABT1G4I5_9GAMM|nr:3-methyl-2-oxobutanoate hydroxymethyltransferase [Natronospira proteinivora]MCP1726199.1 3-methyl-2-oxobutanoate hydroxymethyltransferase [Natronospira proteinivora]